MTVCICVWCRESKRRENESDCLKKGAKEVRDAQWVPASKPIYFYLCDFLVYFPFCLLFIMLLFNVCFVSISFSSLLLAPRKRLF